MMKLTKKLWAPKTALVIGICYTLLITVLFLSPAPDLPKVQVPSLDKVVHLFIYLVLTVLWLLAVLRPAASSKGKIRWVLAIIVSYGIIIEILQETISENRTADVWDIGANVIGMCIGVVVFQNLNKRITSKK